MLDAIISWFRDLVKYFISEAPYPLKIAFWVFLFLSMAGIFSLIFSFNTLCDSNGQEYQPDTTWWAFKLNTQKIGMESGLNVSVINQSLDDLDQPSIWAQAWYFWSSGDYQERFKVTYADYIAVGQYLEYEKDLRAHASPKEVNEDELLNVKCVGFSSRFFIGGVDVMNKELWLVILIMLWVGPLLLFALKQRRG